jgi:hypothetical protein
MERYWLFIDYSVAFAPLRWRRRRRRFPSHQRNDRDFEKAKGSIVEGLKSQRSVSRNGPPGFVPSHVEATLNSPETLTSGWIDLPPQLSLTICFCRKRDHAGHSQLNGKYQVWLM